MKRIVSEKEWFFFYLKGRRIYNFYFWEEAWTSFGPSVAIETEIDLEVNRLRWQFEKLNPKIPLASANELPAIKRTVWPDGLFVFQYLAIYNNENLPNSFIFTKLGSKFYKIINN